MALSFWNGTVSANPTLKPLWTSTSPEPCPGILAISK
jgi:hypothetical protein